MGRLGGGEMGRQRRWLVVVPPSSPRLGFKAKHSGGKEGLDLSPHRANGHKENTITREIDSTLSTEGISWSGSNEMKTIDSFPPLFLLHLLLQLGIRRLV